MFALRDSRSPLADLQVASSSLNRLFDEAFRGWPEAAGQIAGAWMPPVDVFENTSEVRIVAELPGIRPEDIRISVENNVLTLSGQKAMPAMTESKDADRAHRAERLYGSFERRFTVPNTVDTDKIVAKAELGVLTLTLPKAERAKPRQIAVQVQA